MLSDSVFSYEVMHVSIVNEMSSYNTFSTHLYTQANNTIIIIVAICYVGEIPWASTLRSSYFNIIQI